MRNTDQTRLKWFLGKSDVVGGKEERCMLGLCKMSNSYHLLRLSQQKNVGLLRPDLNSEGGRGSMFGLR